MKMITALRYGLNFNIYRYTTKLAGRQVYSGFGRSIDYLSCRQIHDKQVNKRALEARSKLKPPNFPDTRPCPPDPKEMAPNRQKMCTGIESASRNRQTQCGNAEVLKANDCQKPPTGGDGCKKEPESSNLKWLLALLALGGLAGLIWFLNRKKEEEQVIEEEVKSSIYGVKVPASSADIPKYVPYLLIGGGTASFSAFRAIKSHDPTAKVLIITDEYHKPYMRPPLSKELWYHATPGEIPKDYRFKQWNGAERSLFYEADEFYVDPTKLMETANGGVAVCQGYHVRRVDSCNQQVILSDGTAITYDKCLLATGCSPKSLEVFEAAPRNVKEKITKFRTPFDYEALKEASEKKKSIVVIGSGFLGSELACALAKYGRDKDLKVYQIFHESGNMAKVLPEYLSKWTTKQVQEQGVCVIPYAQVSDASSVHNHVKLNLSNGQSILTDHVVLCVGCEPNTELASTSDLEVDNKLGGFVVNAELEARRHLFVAGDAACFYDPLLGRRRVEHHDHSVVSGRLAGENMVGLRKPYTHQSMFWSDLGPEIGYEAIGIVDASLPTVGVFAKATPEDLKKPETHLESVSYQTEQDKPTENSASGSLNKTNEQEETEKKQSSHQHHEHHGVEQYGKGVIFYLKEDKVVGILLWNLFNRINLARQVINENKKFEDLNEVAKLFEIHT